MKKTRSKPSPNRLSAGFKRLLYSIWWAFDFCLSAVPFFCRFSQRYQRLEQRKRHFARWVFVMIVLIIGLFSYLTNPFVRLSVVQDPYSHIEATSDQFQLQANGEVIIREDPFYSNLVFVKSGWHILTGKISGGDKAKKATVDEIISDIHELRFDPERPFLISGDHFSVLYPRSLGIFYHSLLDPRTALSDTDWQNRQLIYLKTVAYALDVFAQTERLSTTIVPVGPKSVALMNIYAPPSETLYSLLYSLDVMTSDTFLRDNYPYQPDFVPASTQLQTQAAANSLLTKHHDSLVRHYETYLRDIVDPATGLIKKDIYLSSTKDMARRESAFYDNVIMWKTHQLAQSLGLVEKNPDQLDGLKQNILTTFWLEKEGYFLEDLSDKAVTNKWYSSDWLIAYQTGMLDPDNPADRSYLERSISYIQRNAIDQPFGLQYHADPRPSQLYNPVKFGAPSYGSTAIWSNWGMEYTKLLAHLALINESEEYLRRAQGQIESYSYNIKRYQGYPELYNDDGEFYQSRFYKSVRQTGWVVSFEQARAMVEYVDGQMALIKGYSTEVPSDEEFSEPTFSPDQL